LGYLNATKTETNGCISPNNVKNKLLRWGNWDSMSAKTITTGGGIRWDAAEIPSGVPTPPTDHIVAASMYASSKPSFFQSMEWPVYGPDPNTPAVLLDRTLPAEKCFDDTIAAGLPFNPRACYGAGGPPPPPDTTIPSAPTNLRLKP
jgi:hypothetical protein